MAKNTKNKYPAEKTGTKYSEFRNTKRVTPGKVRAGATRPGGDQAATPTEASGTGG